MLNAFRLTRAWPASLTGDPGRVATFYAALFSMTGIHLPYFPVWLAAQGLGPTEIAVVAAAPLAIRVFALPLLTLLADLFGSGRGAIAIYVWGAALLFLALAVVEGFGPILVLSTAAGILWSAAFPLTDAKALAVRTAAADYGRIRVWGSVAFVASNLLGGAALDVLPKESILLLIFAATVLAGLAALRLPASRRIVPRRGARGVGALRALAQPRLALLVLGVGLGQASHAVYYSFGSLHWRAQDFSGSAIGVLWAIGVVAEIILFWRGGRVLAVTGAFGLLALGTAGGVLRWALMSFDPPFAVVVLLQVSHALSFGAVHLGAVYALARFAPAQLAGTAQGLHSISTGLAMALASGASGPLYRALGGDAYLAMAAMAGAALLMVLAAWRVDGGGPQPQRDGSGGETRLPW